MGDNKSIKMDDTPDNMMEDTDDKKSQELSPTTKNRLANLFNRIPKFGSKTRSKDTADSEVSENKLDKVSNSAKNNQQISNSSPIRNLPPTGSYGTLGRRSAGCNLSNTCGGGSSGGHNSRHQMSRTRSSSSDNGFIRTSSERVSYRAPRSSSRYLQAAEAYVNKNKPSVNNNSTWSASSVSRARSRPGLTSDLFQSPVKTHPRTASASPGLHRKQMSSTSGSSYNTKTKQNSSYQDCGVSSTHSTPSRKPNPRRLNSKDIFDDFTEHWVASSPYRAKSVDSLDSSERSSDQGSTVKSPRTPNQRKDHRDGQPGT